MRGKRLTAGAIVVVALALVGAGCGGDEESSASDAEAWAESFCTAVADWTDELQRIGDELEDPSSLEVEAFEQAADDVATATQDFVEEVRALGAPDTESGDEVRESVETLADTLEEERTDLEDAAAGVSSLTDVPEALTSVGTSLAAMGTAFQQALEAIEDADAGGELETAFEQSDACDEISS